MEPDARFSFIGQVITVEFDQLPALEKKPHRPDRFVWQGTTYHITETISEWVDNKRTGRMANNMREENLRRARRSGSWGVGRFYFRVRIADGRVFDLYYDRAPQGAAKRKGSWHLYREIISRSA
ncbi:MAG: DUF6504 family protein [Chloroflexota bacterium]